MIITLKNMFKLLINIFKKYLLNKNIELIKINIIIVLVLKLKSKSISSFRGANQKKKNNNFLVKFIFFHNFITSLKIIILFYII